MKKIYSILLVLIMMLGVCSCASDPEDIPDSGTDNSVDSGTDNSVDSGADNGTNEDLEQSMNNNDQNNTNGESTTCAHQYEMTVETPAKALKDGVKQEVCTLCGDTKDEKVTIPATKSLKVLAIGNSFSEDAMEHLWGICNDAGIETVVLGNLRIGGCDLDKHWGIIQGTIEETYWYDKHENGTKSQNGGKTFNYGLTDENWDIITIQQVSGKSGQANTFTNMDNIVNYIKENCTNPDVQIMWQMSWAYAKDSTHGNFPSYGSDQMTMYNAIVNATKTVVATKNYMAGIIPSGTAVQNMRTSYIGDNMDRDGHHMSYDLGRYTVAMTWYAYLTGGSVEAVDWVPTAYPLIAEHLEVVRECVANAVEKPYEITQSEYTAYVEKTDADYLAALGLNPSDYKSLSFTYTVGAFWNSTSDAVLQDTTSNRVNFIALPLYTKAHLPVGSVIIVDEGYQYRPDGWINADGTKNPTNMRPNNVTTSATLVTEEWWGSFVLRGINLSSTVSNTAMAATDAIHIRIYVTNDYVAPDPVTFEKEYEKVTATYQGFGDGAGGQRLDCAHGDASLKFTEDVIKAVWDGNADTVYCNYLPGNAGSWTSAKLAKATVIGKITLSTIWNPTANIGTAIQASVDGVEWTTLYTVSGNEGSFVEGNSEWKLESHTITVDDSTAYNYIRVYDTSGSGYCLSEVAVYTEVTP